MYFQIKKDLIYFEVGINLKDQLSMSMFKGSYCSLLPSLIKTKLKNLSGKHIIWTEIHKHDRQYIYL